jgi:DNA polymerase I
MKVKGVLFDVKTDALGDESAIKLVIKNDKGIVEIHDKHFRPYFFVDFVDSSHSSDIERMVSSWVNSGIIKIEKYTKYIDYSKTQPRQLLKITCKNPADVTVLRESLRNITGVYEADIPFTRRYIIDKQLRPTSYIEADTDEEGNLIAIHSFDYFNEDEPFFHDMNKDVNNDVNQDVRQDVKQFFNILCFDIEVYAPYVVPREKKDPIIIISYYDMNRKKVGAITWKSVDGIDSSLIELTVVNDEKEMLKRFCELVRERNIDILVGYNSASFDLPYLAKRAKVLGIDFPLGRDGSEPQLKKTGMTTRVSIEGRAHFDVFYIVRLLAAAQALKTQRYTLEEVYAEMLGKKKLDLEEHEMTLIWDNDERRKEFIEYACSDAEATAEIFENVCPLAFELSRLSRLTLSDISGTTSGQLVESLLMAKAAQLDIIIPNKPIGEELGVRDEEPIVGAYVKLPDPGIYSRIAVFDFRSLYPSIIVSHNIDPQTIKCPHEECRKKNISPIGHHFCMFNEGLIPATLKDLLQKRKELKRRLRIASGEERVLLNARVAALKLTTNTFYGYLRYVRSRWYSREAAESVTAWGRFYIQDVAKKADERGFTTLYQDTDSIFVLLNDKSEEDAIRFMNEVNAALPETMELELEDFYTRGVFVAKKHEKGEKGAKKKYALISKDGRIKIRGFELVRRDWSKIARDTQSRVLQAILVDGSKEKAVSIVREVILNLREGKVNKEDLVIYTQLRKKSYEVLSPEIAAAEKARKRGMRISMGAIIGYIITRNGRSISEKAELSQFATDYDPNYYIDNQVMPAILKILGQLGYSEEDILHMGKQASLDEWI